MAGPLPSVYENWKMRFDASYLAEAAGITLDDWQKQLVRSPSQRILLNASRQSGKSLVTAVLATWTALFSPGSLVLIVSPSLRQSSETFRKALHVYQALGRPVPAESESKLSLELSNQHSRIVALPGKESTIRGMSPNLIIIDEASRVEDELFYSSVLPMLSVSQGRLVLLSTPWGSRGFYYNCYRNRQAEGFEYYEIPATQVSRIAPDFLESQRRLMADYWFQSEFMCQFLQPAGAVFSAEDIAGIVDPEVDVWTFKTQPKRTIA